MSVPHIVILGAGAAGVAAARALAARDDVAVTLVGRTGETPYIRMHVKGVAFGPTPPELIKAPLPSVEYVADSAVEVDADARRVRLESGAVLDFDALVVATGSTPRALDETIRVTADAAARITPLHSLEDAERIRGALHSRPGRAHVAVYGGGLTAAETASMLHADGHGVTLVSRSELPGVSAFGPAIAAQIVEDHARRIVTYRGRTIDAVETGHDERPVITLDSGVQVAADLLVVALGTTPHSPAPWTGAIDVDDRQRTDLPGVYAAGGVAVHHDELLGAWRIDHWDDSAAQGGHAAAAIVHDLGLGDDPGPYLPRSAHIAMVHGRAISGIGHTGAAGTLQDGDELVVLHEVDGVVVGASGIDAVPTVYQWASRLHQHAHAPSA